MQVTTIGLDIAKRVFQVHGVDCTGAVVIRKKLRRSELAQFFAHLAPCLIGIEACATAHHWARELMALGHQVRLVPPSYVKAYLKRGKNDAADAEAICEAVTRPNMRFVPVKSEEQQGVLVLHRGRELLVRQRTMLVNGLRAHMAEFGIIVPQGIQRVPELVAMLKDETTGIPQIAREVLAAMVVQINNLTTSIRQWRSASLPGAAPVMRHGGWRPFRALARSPPRRWQPRSRIRRCSDPVATSRHGSALCRANIRAVARPSLVGSPKWATNIYASC